MHAHTRRLSYANDSYDHTTYTQELVNLNGNDLVEGAEGGFSKLRIPLEKL